MYPKVEHVQLRDTCRKQSIFDSRYRRHVADTRSTFGSRRHVEHSVHTAVTRRILHVECLHVDCVDRLLQHRCFRIIIKLWIICCYWQLFI